ncbi:surfeit locus protein 6 [Falco biarmicus]|uniref:surfeit locus protein 6 n=1 Tax=Falco peregrinus TaxID=8954 RepID=UPI000392DF3A|nr:surfeit locus protein 6 [Falco peregrinus]XP_005442100.1 surfeit locus protein 6 [Falco cherrug]XP_037254877.1 surfeit locus protein 6 [Falco rusticolus]XP_040462187.1 surfeit locus protein 6 [Falco naumanni]XP_056207888.1 surfeit locus protein 6 [Falco biarmicus]
MASLAAQDSYLQGLARKVCVQHAPEPRKRKFVSKPGQPEDAGRQLKKKKRKKPRKQAEETNAPSVKQLVSNASKPTAGQKAALQASKSSPQGVTQSRNEGSAPGSKSELFSPSFSAMNLLRQRLHEKIKKASGQDDAKELPPAVLEKRQRRKYERERKKRRRKELKMKAKTEKKETEEVPIEPESKKEESTAEVVFNRVEVHGENELSKIQKKKEKRKAVKGNITPLTGRNYKQLLSRLETRKNKLEELKDKDQKKAEELENKMKWTNALYKAEGVKIRDNEERLKEALKRKEKRKAQRQRRWEERTEKVVERMQQRQEKRRKNIQKKKKDRIEKKKARARKKGRVLPEDLKKAGL